MCRFCLAEDITDGVFTLSKKDAANIAKSLNIDAVVTDALNQLYDDRAIKDATKKQLFISHYEPLKMAVNEGFGGAKIEYGTPNYEFLKQLQTNTAVFAMFKNHSAMKEMAALLKDAAGNLRSKADFIAEGKKVDATYRTRYLDVEYDTAARSARMASQWQKIVKNKRIYPNLKYIITKAAKPDQNHLKYVGIIQPVDSSFWDTHFPPNRWRCQCGVEQTDSETTDIPGNLPPVPPDFAFNPGKTGQIFDIKNSEYIKSVPPKEQPALIREAKKYVDVNAVKETTYQQVYKSKNGGVVQAHPLALDNGDFSQTIAEARVLANAGANIKILPDINDKGLRADLTPKDAKPGKNPDYLINDQFAADLKTVATGTALAVRKAISRCHEQCDNIVLKITEDNPITSEMLQDVVRGKLSLSAYASFDNVWINFKGKLYKTNRMKIVQLNEWPIKTK